MPTELVLLLILLTLVSRFLEASGLQRYSSSDRLPSQDLVCTNFTGDVDFKDGYSYFHTPGYLQGRYPNKTSCVKLIVADYAFSTITLDFRDTFFIEESSKCEHDFLEVRDGPYGYSPKLGGIEGRYCGKISPKAMSSTGPFMWLRFFSDETIEHRGVMAVHKIKRGKPAKEECRIVTTLALGGQHVMSDRDLKDKFPSFYNKHPSTPADCSLEVMSPKDTRILVSLERLRVRSDEKCKQQAITIYDGFTTGQPKPLCSTLEPKQHRLLTNSQRAIVRVTAKDTYFLPEFLVVFTVVRAADTCQVSTEFKCDSGCVDSRLKCNDHINCLEGEDEVDCKTKSHTHDTETQEADSPDKQETVAKAEMSYHPIILGSIGTGFLILTFVCCCLTLKQRLRERRQLESEAARTPVKSLSRGPSFHQEADDSLMPQTALPSYPGNSCHGNSYAADSVKQNGTLAPATPASVRSVTGASTRLAATPSKVRVSKFLEPTGPECPAESPIEMFGSEGPSYSAQVLCATQHGHSRSLPRSIMKQESFDTSASSRDAEVSSSYRAFAFPPPPPPPPPQASDRRQQSVPPDTGIVQSRSIPGQLAGSATETVFTVGQPSPRCLRRQQQQQHNQQQQDQMVRTASRRTTKLVFQA